MKKVLIVSYFFPPVNIIASKRYGTMCKYFEENGYIPYVLTIKHDEAMGAGIRLDHEIPIDKRQIIKVGSVRHAVEALNPIWSIMFEMLEHFKLYSRTIEAGGNGWYEQVKAEEKLKIFRDIDVIIGTFPPMTNLFIALYLSRKLRVPFIAEIRDLISDYSEPLEEYKRTFLIDRVIEWHVLQKAAAIVTVTSGFKKILGARYPKKKIKVVYNGWDGERQNKHDTQENQTVKYLYYAGTLYLHRLESFKLLVSCLKRINTCEHEKIKFIIRSGGPSDLTARAQHIVQQEGMMEYVHVLESVSEDVVRQEQEKAYINIVLSSIHDEDKALMTTVPGKVYELLKERAPVLAIVPDDSDVAKVLDYTNKGMASIKENEIVEFIIKKNKNYVGNQKIDFFSRRNQAKHLCKFMDQLLVD